jgi:shikimate kinase
LTTRHDPEAPIYLVGFMGVGKSTVGRALAARLGWEFADTDALVESAEGRTVEAIFRASGEGRFREAEWDALRSLGGRKQLVVATGGGLFLGRAQRAFMRDTGVSCWLDAPLSVVAARIGAGALRPAWPVDDALLRRAFFERRRAAYALADFRIDASVGRADDVARALDLARRSFWR